MELDALTALTERMTVVAAQLERVHGEVAARTAGLDWQGAAAGQHADAQRRCATGAQLLHDGLAELRAAVSTAHGNYLAAVEANRRMWAR